MDVNDVGINGSQEKMESRLYAQNAKHHIGIRRERMMLEIKNNKITVLEAVYLLSNYEGYLDGDVGCLRITGNKQP